MHFLDYESFTTLVPDEETCIKRLVEYGVFHGSVNCTSCDFPMQLVLNQVKKVFRCPKAACGHREVSYRIGSSFHSSMLKTLKIMRIARCWLLGETHGIAVLSTGLDTHTIRTWYSAFRELVYLNMQSNRELIGGPGIIVEVDETLLGRRKNNRGHHVEGAWTIVGIERGSQRRAFGVVVESRDAETIRRVIRMNVREESILYTDEWRGYIGVDEACNVVHRTVKHKDGFVDRNSGVCTNTVEGLNRALKHSIPPRFRNNQYAPQFVEQFFWKRRNKARLCESFIRLLASSLLDN